MTGERCRCATTLLAQVGRSRAVVLGMAALPLRSCSTLHGVKASSVGPASLSREAHIHPLLLRQAPAEDGIGWTLKSISDLVTSRLIWHWGSGEKQTLLDTLHLALMQNVFRRPPWALGGARRRTQVWTSLHLTSAASQDESCPGYFTHSSSYFFPTGSLCLLPAADEELALALPNLALAGKTPGGAPPGYDQLEKESASREK